MHILTNYPPANLNRDDLGRPKTAIVGGRMRLRISSQCIKRAWRTSDAFQSALAGHMGVRTKEAGLRAYLALTRGATYAEALAAPLDLDREAKPDKKALDLAGAIAGCFGKAKAKDAKNPFAVLETEQMVHIGPAEIAAVQELLDVFKGGAKIDEKELVLLRKSSPVDVAMFGRMIAAEPAFNTDAAVQVAHPISVNTAHVEDDFFTAVDDLNRMEEDAGAGHMGIQEFGAGLFYLYVCVDRGLLVKNLDGNEDLARKALRALAEAACTVAPSGKQNSFGSRAYASYLLAERGPAQPRNLSVAFLDPIEPHKDAGMLAQAVDALRTAKKTMDGCYDMAFESRECLVGEGGSMAEVWDFVAE
jgi:CRISPR system Cascade subunit CasC